MVDNIFDASNVLLNMTLFYPLAHLALDLGAEQSLDTMQRQL
jgi:hypothetical protein